MALRTVVLDLRGMSGWTKSQRQRHADLGLVAPTNTQNPLVFVPKTGVHLAPGWLEYDGNTSDKVYSSIKHMSQDHPFPDGNPFVLWTDGRAVLYGLNLASPGCAEAFAERVVLYCEWAKGVCLDYFTNTAWLLVEREGGTLPKWASEAYYADFDAGLRVVAATFRRLRPDWFVTGYQYHKTAATSALDGPFLEDRYTRTMQLTDIRDYINGIAAARNTLDTFGILEQRDMASYSEGQSRIIAATCEQYQWYLSRGRDATAVGGG